MYHYYMGKKYFTIADIKKGYWKEILIRNQVCFVLSKHFERSRFKQHHFRFTICQDIKVNAIFSVISNVSGIADGIIIFGFTKEKHDTAFP